MRNIGDTDGFLLPRFYSFKGVSIDTESSPPVVLKHRFLRQDFSQSQRVSIRLS